MSLSRSRAAGACETDNAQHWAKPDRAAAARESTPVHPGDGLHEAVALHRLVGIHRVQAGHVKAGQPVRTCVLKCLFRRTELFERSLHVCNDFTSQFVRWGKVFSVLEGIVF